MNLSEHLTENCITINPDLEDKNSLLRVIAETAKRNKILKKVTADEIYAKLLKREELGSTGFGNEIAIPHCALSGISDFVIGIVTVEKGIEFNSLDGEKVKLFVFIIAPANKRNEHIHYLSAISSVLKNPAAVKQIIACQQEKALKDTFLSYLPEAKEGKEEKELNLIQIFIQSEDKFEDIIAILMEVENINIAVIEADNAEKYLHHLPLFSSFWSETRKSYQKIVIAAIEKPFTNDVIRKINLIIDGLPDKKGILLLMQNIAYYSGSLEI